MPWDLWILNILYVLLTCPVLHSEKVYTRNISKTGKRWMMICLLNFPRYMKSFQHLTSPSSKKKDMKQMILSDQLQRQLRRTVRGYQPPLFLETEISSNLSTLTQRLFFRGKVSRIW